MHCLWHTAEVLVIAPSRSTPDSPAREWQARLGLGYALRGTCTTLVRREHLGPLRVQRPFYPEGPEVCHTYLLHPPAGIAAGDRIEVSVSVEEGAHVLLTTPGAAKWYRSAGAWATQDVEIRVGKDASVEWLPQETILFHGARAITGLCVDLAPGATFLGWEITCLGRVAAGERFAAGHLRQQMQIVQAGICRWYERADLVGGSPLLTSPVGLRGCPISGLLLVAGGDAGNELIAACRAIGVEPGALCGITTMPGVLAVRYLGQSSECAMRYFRALWGVLRPAMLHRTACPPRIWNT